MAGLVATPGVSWGGNQVLLKLLSVGVQVATPGGRWDGNQVV